MVVALVLVAGTESNAQLFPTNLKVTVIDGLGNFTKDAEVTIYQSKKDYENSVNAVQKNFTDKKGRVKFKKLDVKAYYIDVRKGDMNNDGEGVLTETLSKGKSNRINVVIE